MTREELIDKAMELAVAIVADDLEPICCDGISEKDKAEKTASESSSALSKYIA
jgi:hypothetical protein